MNRNVRNGFYFILLLCLSLVVYACAEITFTITFETNGAGSVDVQVIESGKLIVEPTISKNGYVLEGWYTSNDQGLTLDEKWIFTSSTPKSNLVLYAKWVAIDYTITFNTNGGNQINPIQATYQQVISLPAEPTKTNYEFEGWYTNSNLTIPFDPSQGILENITLYAKWSVIPYDIALITDTGHVNDGAYNQAAWEGIELYATDNNKTYNYYAPTAISFNDYMDAIALAANEGAKVIVAPGFLFENSVHKAQYLYPDINFILIDGVPHNISDWGTMTTYDGSSPDYSIATNTVSIYFNEHEAGFLAGYAAYKDGLEGLGFMGGMAVPAVIRFGIGYVAGAYYAAYESQELNYSFNSNYYAYLSTFAPSDQIVTQASAWFLSGQVDAIFTVSGGGGFSVIAAAEQYNKKVIGVDFDQSSMSNTVITSAMKNISLAVYLMLEMYDDGQQAWGMTVELSASEGGVGLPVSPSSWRFQSFTLIEYLLILDKLSNGTVVVPSYHAELEQFIQDLGFSSNQALISKI